MKIGYGTITGSQHKKLEYNNQDYVLVTEYDDYTIGLIADGCGSGTNSEVGAQLSLNFITKWIHENIERDWKSHFKGELQNYSQNLAETHSINTQEFIMNYLLYTIVGFILRDNQLTVFSCGDGIIMIGDELNIINQENRPKYINNELIGQEGGEFEFRELSIDSEIVMLGSDGLLDLIEGISKGLVDEYQSLNAFKEDDRHFLNPIHIPKLLQKYSNNGLLRDDCSIIMLRS